MNAQPCSISPIFFFSLFFFPFFLSYHWSLACTPKETDQKASSTVWQTTRLSKQIILQVDTDGRRYSCLGKMGELSLHNRRRDQALLCHFQLLLFFFLLGHSNLISGFSSPLHGLLSSRLKYIYTNNYGTST